MFTPNETVLYEGASANGMFQTIKKNVFDLMFTKFIFNSKDNQILLSFLKLH